uniref:Uncharacterized protein n=1 Tax=Manihot esculenta TaxID=3983 RepID=A0A2C9VIX3_MANES
MKTFPFLLLIFLLTGEYVCGGVAQLAQCNAADREALLDFKMGLNDSWNGLSSWQGTNCCQWSGISCDNTTGVVLSVDITPSSELKFLKHLDLSSNDFNGTLPTFLGNMTSLLYLDLSRNDFKGEIPNSLGQLKNLTHLSLCYNSLQGLIPAFTGNLQQLAFLELNSNKLNGTLPDSLGQLSELIHLDVSSNELTGIISEAHFLQLNKLNYLSLSANSLSFNVSSNWVPPFQISGMDMDSCHFGSSFPAWLKSQKEMQYLVISNCSISGSIPNWFWGKSENLVFLNVSFNDLDGQLPNSLNLTLAKMIDFSHNHFQGLVPFILAPNAVLLDLSNNQFSGPMPSNISQMVPALSYLSLSSNQLNGEIPASIGEMKNLEKLDLSRNNLTGSIPSSIGNCPFLQVLDLQNNTFFGGIPTSLGQLSSLLTLRLSKNLFSGEIPSSLQNMSYLQTLDLSNNMLTGRIPPWIGETVFALIILSLRSNNFYGELPPALSNLTSLQILDLAENKFNGSFPASYGNIKAMTHLQNEAQRDLFLRDFYNEYMYAIKNGLELLYTKNLYLLTIMDLSGNNLSGELSSEITKLVGLKVLNLSRNHINGQIPENISELRELLSLDLSSNMLSGPIPQGMSSMSFLGSLNLSNNNLSDRIPYKGHMTTFDASSFAGNSGLCGEPLVLKCPDDDTNNHDDPGDGRKDEADDGNEFIDKWFYLSIGLGFAAGLLLPFLVFSIKRSWGGVYFSFVDATAYRLSNRKMRAATRRRI